MINNRPRKPTRQSTRTTKKRKFSKKPAQMRIRGYRNKKARLQNKSRWNNTNETKNQNHHKNGPN